MKTAPLRVLATGLGDPAWNMALDESLLIHAGSHSLPALRFYGWSLPAATFGYSQHYADIARLTLLRPLIRRPTGGGLVPHDRDWTYSLTLPPGHPWFELRATDSYRTIHTWISEAFTRLNVPTTLAPNAQVAGPGQCFVGFEQSDLLWHGRKIAGAAQRRNRRGLLIQGSIQPPPGILRADWESAMRQTAHRYGFGEIRNDAPSGAECAEAERLTATQYSRDSYNQRR